MIIASLILAALAALLHVYIFYLESIAWQSDRARATFGTSNSEAVSTKELAFNQGFYNLFLAIATVIGIFFIAFGQTPIGSTLIFTGTGSMLAAALVLLISSPDKRNAAIKQGTLPLLTVILLSLTLMV